MQRATNLQKSMKRSAKAVDSPQVKKERPSMSFCCQWKASASFSKNTFYDKASGSALSLIFDQISGFCSYKITLIKNNAVYLFIFTAMKQ